jgi:hypothetical protein
MAQSQAYQQTAESAKGDHGGLRQIVVDDARAKVCTGGEKHKLGQDGYCVRCHGLLVENAYGLGIKSVSETCRHEWIHGDYRNTEFCRLCGAGKP